jgi:ureidoacrylate peracid hydrolase
VIPIAIASHVTHLDRDRCAVVVVDLQNDYCHEDGALALMGRDVAAVQAMIPDVARMIDAARAAGVPVIFVRTTHGEWTDTPAWVERGRGGPSLDTQRVPIVRAGTWGAEFYGVAPGEGDHIVTKHRYSAFLYTPLELALRAKRRDTILLAGATTNICVAATATDGLMRGFSPILVRQCVATHTEAEQAAAFAEFEDHVGVVADLADLLDVWAAPVTA